jgi:KRAB domain-containing zinc finger protein
VNEEEKLKAGTDAIESKPETKFDSDDKKKYENKCNRCGKDFKFKIGLNLHIRSKKCKKTEKEIDGLTDENKSIEVADGKSFEKHLRTHVPEKNFKCRFCGKIFEHGKNRNQHESLHTAPAVECEKCGKELKNQKILMQHYLEVHNKRKFKCNICKEVLSSKRGLLSHEKSHTAPRVKCQKCGKELKNQKTLKQHYLDVHNKRKFECKMCKSNLSTKRSLLSHERIHTAPKVTCRKCGMELKNLASLRTHLNTHKTGKKFKRWSYF